MSGAGERASALEAALAFLRSDMRFAERWKIAELYLIVAQLYWRQRRVLSSFLSFGRALMTQPTIVGRPLKLLLRRAGVTSS